MSYSKRQGRNARLLNVPTFSAVYEAVRKGKAEYGIVPLENSIEGNVIDTHKLLLWSALSIVGEVYVDVHHCLMACNDVRLEEVKAVYSHPQALGQCREFIERRGWATMPVHNTAAAAKMIKEQAPRHAAAIASERSAEVYGLRVLQRDIEDETTNCTRFIVLTSKDTVALPTGNDKTSLIVVLPHKPNALSSALVSLGGINLTRISSMPMKGKPWEYLFYMDIKGHSHDERISKAINDLSERSLSLVVLGSYPKADPEIKNS